MKLVHALKTLPLIPTLPLLAVVGLTTGVLTACGDGLSGEETASATMMGPDSFYISPLNVKSTCFQPVPTSIGLIATMGNCSGITPPRIRDMSGQPYRPGFGGYVTISVDGQCLTNPNPFNGQDQGYLTFTPCNDDGTEYGVRQMWMLKANQYGATQIISNAALILHKPNPQSECMERPTPGSLKRQPCSGLGNWMTWQ
jgi:hypothetical protein